MNAMRPRPKPRRRVGAAVVIPEHRPERAEEGLVLHPDGWYWTAPDGHQQFGPFESAEAARADRDRDEAEGPETERVEAEEELGVHPWLDPETGEPAEGAAPPHLDTEEGPNPR